MSCCPEVIIIIIIIIIYSREEATLFMTFVSRQTTREQEGHCLFPKQYQCCSNNQELRTFKDNSSALCFIPLATSELMWNKIFEMLF
jgi:hypothetical protein